MAVKSAVLALLAIALPVFEVASNETWVTADRLNIRTCPDVRCGTVGFLMFREGATIYEERNGWGRVSKYYDVFCRKGLSQYVESGNAACVESNGIVDGRLLSGSRCNTSAARVLPTRALVPLGIMRS
jgi:hypothetical protein